MTLCFIKEQTNKRVPPGINGFPGGFTGLQTSNPLGDILMQAENSFNMKRRRFVAVVQRANKCNFVSDGNVLQLHDFRESFALAVFVQAFVNPFELHLSPDKDCSKISGNSFRHFFGNIFRCVKVPLNVTENFTLNAEVFARTETFLQRLFGFRTNCTAGLVLNCI